MCIYDTRAQYTGKKLNILVLQVTTSLNVLPTIQGNGYCPKPRFQCPDAVFRILDSDFCILYFISSSSSDNCLQKNT